MKKTRSWIVIATVLLGILIIIVWRWHEYEESKWDASLIEHWCNEVQEDCSDVKSNSMGGIKSPDDAVNFLSLRLAFLMGLYDADIKNVSPNVEPTVTRDYHRTLEITVDLMRKLSTTDLGSDPKAWVAKYANE